MWQQYSKRHQKCCLEFAKHVTDTQSAVEYEKGCRIYKAPCGQQKALKCISLCHSRAGLYLKSSQLPVLVTPYVSYIFLQLSLNDSLCQSSPSVFIKSVFMLYFQFHMTNYINQQFYFGLLHLHLDCR